MQARQADAMTWNRYVDWQDTWKEGGQDGRGWFEQPSDADCTTQFNAYGSWQPGPGGTGYGDCGQVHLPNGIGMGNGAVQQMYIAEPEIPDASAMGDLGFEGHGHHQMVGHGTAGSMRQMPFGSQGHQQVAQPQTSYFGAAAAAQSNGHRHGQDHGEVEDDQRRMAELEDSMSSMLQLPHDSSDEEDERTRKPAEATAEEREEAERVVRIAFKEAKERDKLREKVKKASPSDLQALLNARLAKK
mmetsp:Transcript_15508/g.32755  ORF Transcript_15508/g.32755 Transcript_15508/m.32755 type:complete len:244 (+) Transcript_15508:121-852(+)